jgi:hypothetical protein
MAISDKQREMILQGLENGLSLRKACAKAEVDPPRVLKLAASDDDFGQHYARARQLGWSLLADDIEGVAEDMQIPADHKRIMVDTRKWMLSKMLPKVYGDRLDLIHSGKVTTGTTGMTDEELLAIAAKGKPGGDA